MKYNHVQDALDSRAWEWGILKGRTVTIGLQYSLETQDATLNLYTVYFYDVGYLNHVDSQRVEYPFFFL